MCVCVWLARQWHFCSCIVLIGGAYSIVVAPLFVRAIAYLFVCTPAHVCLCVPRRMCVCVYPGACVFVCTPAHVRLCVNTDLETVTRVSAIPLMCAWPVFNLGR